MPPGQEIIDDETFVMTTWHEDESVENVIFFGLMWAHGSGEITVHPHILILSIGPAPGLREDVQQAITATWSSENFL